MEQIEQIQREHPDQRVEVWVEDEARFGQQGTLTRKWAPRGSRPPAVKQTAYEYLYLMGAACAQTGQAVGVLAPYLNTKMVNVFLKQMAAEIDPQTHVVLVWDRAGYHTAAALEVPKNMTLLPLPPSSPELNPMENLWHYLRAHHLANRSYPNHQALLDAAGDAWRTSCLDRALIKTVCHTPYLESRGVKA